MNHILKIALNNKRELIGRRVKYNGTNYDRLKYGNVCTIKEAKVGNHDCFLVLKDLPNRLCFPFTSREEGPGNTFDSKLFELEDEG